MNNTEAVLVLREAVRNILIDNCVATAPNRLELLAAIAATANVADGGAALRKIMDIADSNTEVWRIARDAFYATERAATQPAGNIDTSNITSAIPCDTNKMKLIFKSKAACDKFQSQLYASIFDSADTGMHPDDIAVDKFAAAIKTEMAAQRSKGRGGWDDPAQCHTQELAASMIRQIDNGEIIKVSAYAMMLFNRNCWPADLVGAMSLYFQEARRLAAPISEASAPADCRRYCQREAEQADSSSAAPSDAVLAGLQRYALNHLAAEVNEIRGMRIMVWKESHRD